VPASETGIKFTSVSMLKENPKRPSAGQTGLKSLFFPVKNQSGLAGITPAILT
jgi:hypothetical protein